MSKQEAEKILKSVREFIQDQRIQRSNETRQPYQRDGSHVTVGESQLLRTDFLASDQK